MTESRCWIDYKNDRRMRQRAEEGKYGTPTASYTCQLYHCPKNGYWPSHLVDWCKLRKIPYRDDEYGKDGAAISRATVTRAQILDFLAFMYDDPHQTAKPARERVAEGYASRYWETLDLKEFVKQEFDPHLTYELVADVW